ncbi:unnamed protein product [Brassica napus]|uniref:(rape) hypothetical protein n=1 Tax=Brassica napus TaxID=3708 RepID=A0A816QM42_BRANA|nr:unnamed protein product [Brassica napus]
MLSFVLLYAVRFLSSVVSLCLCGAPAPVLQALAGSRIFYNLLVCSEWTLDGMIAGAGTPNRLRLSRPLIPFGISSAPELFLDL